ncbi:MAG TPA: NADH-quinone oxidoreductase subunit C [Deltaproteobacteria bacterium]|nr:MAG: NADH-quinone oxidoreductase subunit C [candidate division KSB1 bacterium]HDM78045.1 NADH-quinone oxidoreductase subunit C [Deltaproteobacteria bacterium]
MNKLKETLESAFSDLQVSIPEDDRLTIIAPKDAVLSILSFLKSKGYEHLALVSCVDWIEEEEFELIYILSAYMQKDDEYTDKEKTNIILKTRISREKPECTTVIPIFKNAEPYERELHELFGIHFEGHPRLTPLFLEREYKIPPFRKDFDTREYVKKVFDEIPFVEDKIGQT